MYCGETLFTRKKAEAAIEKDGFTRGTTAFWEEFKRRFVPAEGFNNRYVEI